MEPKVHVHVYNEDVEANPDPIVDTDAEYTDTYEDLDNPGFVDYHQYGFTYKGEYIEIRVSPNELEEVGQREETEEEADHNRNEV